MASLVGTNQPAVAGAAGSNLIEEPDVEFSYRLVAKRLDYEDHRLERAPWADSDPNVNPNATRTAQMQLMNEGEQ